MRIDAISVSNFRGLARAEVNDLATSPLVTVSGPNGAGKSLLFEAITLLWRAGRPWGQYNLNLLVGPWAETSTITITFSLTDPECALLTQYGRSRGDPLASQDAPQKLKVRVEITKEGTHGRLQHYIENEWAKLFWEHSFSQSYEFAHIDYLPADRSIQRGEQAQVNPSLLNVEQVEGLRQQVFDSFIQQRQIFTLSGIQPFLASLDYLDMLRQREGKPSTGDFDALAEPFFQATGKKINRPSIDSNSPFGASLYVDTPSGYRHSIDQLSSGEQEVLSLMFYVRRLSSSGGLLLIDEPELHLHPALQQSFFAVVENVAERAQVWVVTHSAKLVTSAPLTTILHMSPPTASGINQLTKASDEELRGRLLTDLGVHPIDVLQNDSLIVVEGSMDAARLPSVLPGILSRSIIYTAGNAQGVEATARTLQSSRSVIPWIAIRDRDLLSDEEVASRKSALKNLFVWPNRTLENELLDPSLVARTLERAGRSTESITVRDWLREIAELQKMEILASLIEDELRRRHPYPSLERSTPVEDKMKFLRIQEETIKAKLEVFTEVAQEVESNLNSRWDDDWFKLMDGKRALAQLLPRTPFQKIPDFVSALTRTLRDEADGWPKGLAEFREQAISMLSMTAGGVPASVTGANPG